MDNRYSYPSHSGVAADPGSWAPEKEGRRKGGKKEQRRLAEAAQRLGAARPCTLWVLDSLDSQPPPGCRSCRHTPLTDKEAKAGCPPGCRRPHRCSPSTEWGNDVTAGKTAPRRAGNVLPQNVLPMPLLLLLLHWHGAS